jgi:hypothetical protein
MKFFFPDSHDLVDPSFNFRTERRQYAGSRQQAQLYAHEVFSDPPYDGMLISKAIIDGRSKSARYSFSQRQRLKRIGAREFLRLDAVKSHRIETMGDCGSFSYVAESEPPFSVQEVVDFYVDCKFDYGISLDHVILGYSDELFSVPEDWLKRFDLTLELARDFLTVCHRARVSFEPIGTAQGWSPESYARSVAALQLMGYRYIALGGMVPLKTPEILASLQAVSEVRASDTRLHLLGITRFDNISHFHRFGVYSCDSTSPLKQAFKDDRDNYYTDTRTYTAVRIPQVAENPKLKSAILAGKVDHAKARKLEKLCLDGIFGYEENSVSLSALLGWLTEYERLWNGKTDNVERYKETLLDTPWRDCACSVCRDLRINVVIFRGSERNRRRGFHNLYTVRHKLNRLSPIPSTNVTSASIL